MGRRKKNGFALLIILLIASIVGGLLVSVGTTTMYHLRTTQTGERDAKTELAARAGLQHALNVLRNDPSRIAPLTGTLQNDFEYEVEFINNYEGRLGKGYVADDGTPVAEDHVYLRVRGYSPGRQGPTFAFSAQAWQPPITNTTAAFGDEGVSVKDTLVEHWEQDSAPPEFLPPVTITGALYIDSAANSMMRNGRPPTMKVTQKFTKALLGTNSKEMSALWAEGDSTIHGNVVYGEGSPISAKSGVVSVIGADASTAQTDAGTSPFHQTPPGGSNVTQNQVASIPDSVDFKGQIEVYSNNIPFPGRQATSGYGSDETFTPPMSAPAAMRSASAPMTSTAAGMVTYQPPQPVMMTDVDPIAFAADQQATEQILPPGRYGRVELTPGSVVRLEEGDYVIDELVMNDASLLVDPSITNPVKVTIQDRLDAVDSEINRYKHAGSAYSSSDRWDYSDHQKQAGNPEKLELYFQGEQIGSAAAIDYDATNVRLENSYMSAATIGKKADTNVTGGAVHGAFRAKQIALDSTKLYHAKRFQSPSKAVSVKGPWTLKTTNRLGRTDEANKLVDNDPWKAIEEQWKDGYLQVQPITQ